MHTVAFVIEQLRRGNIALLTDRTGAGHLILAAQSAGGAALELMMQSGELHLAMTPEMPAILPGLMPVIVSAGGVLQIAAPAEAAVDLMRLAGLRPQALVRALTAQDPAAFAQNHGLPIVSLAALIHHRLHTGSALEHVAVADLPTPHAEHPFRAHSFLSPWDGIEHLALVAPGLARGAPLVRVHSECLTGDALGSLRCDCGPQLQESLRRLARAEGGILIYLRGQEGRGIGLANKIRAYALQDRGLDTVEANRALGLPDDARDFAPAAQMLRVLGHEEVRLLSNNPEKATSLRHHGIKVIKVEPLIMPPNPFNARYLQTKAEKFGHALPAAHGACHRPQVKASTQSAHGVAWEL